MMYTSSCHLLPDSLLFTVQIALAHISPPQLCDPGYASPTCIIWFSSVKSKIDGL